MLGTILHRFRQFLRLIYVTLSAIKTQLVLVSYINPVATAGSKVPWPIVSLTQSTTCNPMHDFCSPQIRNIVTSQILIGVPEPT